jgi:quercetin dioxygenase-like cupin family protein
MPMATALNVSRGTTMYPIPKKVAEVNIPIAESIDEVAGIYFRSVFLPEEGTIIPQHTHTYDHATYVGSGSVRLWVDEQWAGDYIAGQAVRISANKKHLFQSLEPNTRLACIHDTNSAQLIKEAEQCPGQ